MRKISLVVGMIVALFFSTNQMGHAAGEKQIRRAVCPVVSAGIFTNRVHIQCSYLLAPPYPYVNRHLDHPIYFAVPLDDPRATQLLLLAPKAEVNVKTDEWIHLNFPKANLIEVTYDNKDLSGKNSVALIQTAEFHSLSSCLPAMNMVIEEFLLTCHQPDAAVSYSFWGNRSVDRPSRVPWSLS